MSMSGRSSSRLKGAQDLLMRAMRVRLASDMYERAVDWGVRPPLDAKRKRWLGAIRRAGLIFIHVPKNGGMSVNHALYGEHVTHSTMRYYRRVAPWLAETLPSFALVRDPIDRFCSAYRYARAGGGAHNSVSPAFREAYRAFSVDDALDHIEGARSPYEIDHIFRSQSWFLADRAGRIIVDTLVPFTRIGRLDQLIPGFPQGVLAHLNHSPAAETPLSPQHVARLRTLYARDFALYDAVCGAQPVALAPLGMRATFAVA